MMKNSEPLQTTTNPKETATLWFRTRHALSEPSSERTVAWMQSTWRHGLDTYMPCAMDDLAWQVSQVHPGDGLQLGIPWDPREDVLPVVEVMRAMGEEVLALGLGEAYTVTLEDEEQGWVVRYEDRPYMPS